MVALGVAHQASADGDDVAAQADCRARRSRACRATSASAPSDDDAAAHAANTRARHVEAPYGVAYLSPGAANDALLTAPRVDSFKAKSAL